jgi:hypothetical protein
MSARAPVDPSRVRLLLEGGVENLLATWDPDRALFPFSSRLEGSRIVNDHAHPIAVRYTINSLLGLVEAARAQTLGITLDEVREMSERFFAHDPERIELPADQGLALVLQAALGADRGTLAAWLSRVDRAARMSTLTVHDLAWLLWGAAAAARAGAPAEAVAYAALRRIEAEHVDAGTGLPRHSTARYRRDLVSFGSLVYFLRAMHEAAGLGDERARARFEAGVARAIELQGPLGEWPWMINCRSGRVFDFYPVFAVHQDSMAMLFLHPALDRGLPGAGEAIAGSLAWDFGANELGVPMFVREPFFAYRSIERVERAPRARRYARSLRRGGPAATVDARRVRINDECRSYHLGWFLYAWSARL